MTSPTSLHHVGDEPPASSNHTESMSPAIINDDGGINTIENPRRVRHNPIFLCRTCEGNHLTRLCPATIGISKAWFSPGGPSVSKAPMVSPHLASPLIETIVMLMQYSPEHTPIIEGDASPGLVFTHPIQPTVEEVVTLVQYLVNPTLLLEDNILQPCH
jgi:hypothetical protein